MLFLFRENNPNTEYVAAPDQKSINIQYQPGQPVGQPQQQVYMQPAAAPIQDSAEQMAPTLLFVGIVARLSGSSTLLCIGRAPIQPRKNTP